MTSPTFQGFCPSARVAIAGHQDDLDPRFDGFDLADDVESVHAVHLEVSENHIELLF